MNTEKLLDHTLVSLTKSMIERSLPSGGLPIAFRSLLLTLSDMTIKQGDNFKTVNGTSVVGESVSKYYVAGDRPLADDIASMSAEPFPLITSHSGTDITMEVKQQLTSFKNKVTGTTTGLRYMILQFSKLGYEYMKYIEYQPKTYSRTNEGKVNINIKSHVPAELFRSTNFRTLGRGANMYPLNPSEVFYTMYQLIEEGYDIPVSELKHFKGFDLGNKLNTIYMKPEALVSLFDIGIASFVERVHLDVDMSQGKVIFKSFHSRFLGDVFVKRLQAIIKNNDYRLGPVFFDKDIAPVPSVSEDIFLEYSGVRFYSSNEEEVKRELELILSQNLIISYHHYSHRSEVEIKDFIEKDIKLTSKSVREILIECINNFKEIKITQYTTEIEKLEELLADNLIKEKVTRPYLREKIQSLLLQPNDVRINELKIFADMKHGEDPDKYPELTEDVIRDYVWVSQGNDVLPNLNNEGHNKFVSLIENQLHQINQLKEKLKDENIEEEIKKSYLTLSKIEDFQRKSPVEFLNDSLDITRRQLLLEASDLIGNSSQFLPTKVHYYENSPLTKTLGENIPKGYYPLYTIKTSAVSYQSEGMLDHIFTVDLPDLKDERNLVYNTFAAEFVFPSNRRGIYLTSHGNLGIWDKAPTTSRDYLDLSPGEFVIDFIDIHDIKDYSTKKIVLLKNENMAIYGLDDIMKIHNVRGHLKYDENRLFFDIKSMEMIDSEEELDQMYVFQLEPRTFVKLAYLKGKYRIGEQFYLDNIVSGYKRAYLNGVHVPIDIVNNMAGTNLKDGEHLIDYDYPENLNKFTIILNDDYRNNDPRDIEQLKRQMWENIRENEMDEKFFYKLAGFDFIREV